MMDLWHCHKPDVKHGRDDDVVTAGKGYAATSKLVAKSGIGFVDPMAFLLAEQDCLGIKVRKLFVSNFSRTCKASRYNYQPSYVDWVYKKWLSPDSVSVPTMKLRYKSPRLKRQHRSWPIPSGELVSLDGFSTFLLVNFSAIHCYDSQAPRPRRITKRNMPAHHNCPTIIAFTIHACLIRSTCALS